MYSQFIKNLFHSPMLDHIIIPNHYTMDCFWLRGVKNKYTSTPALFQPHVFHFPSVCIFKELGSIKACLSVDICSTLICIVSIVTVLWIWVD